MSLYRQRPSIVEFDDDPLISVPRAICIGFPLADFMDSVMARKSIELGTRIGGGEIHGSFCVSDGGYGFHEAFLSLKPFQRQRVVTMNAMGRMIMTEYLYDQEERAAVFEVGQVLGSGAVAAEGYSVMGSSSAGLADLILDAMVVGAERLYFGLGDTVAWDGGRGMLMRLHDVLEKRKNERVHYTTQELTGAKTLGLPALCAHFREIEINVCTNTPMPLLGEKGTARTALARQRITHQEAGYLEGALRHWTAVIEKELGEPFSHLPGAGAAGGLANALVSLGGQIVPSAALFFDLYGLEARMARCDGLVTCERRLTKESFETSAPWKACRIARRMGRHALLVCVEADSVAIDIAAKEGVAVVNFGQAIPPERRLAEGFTLLQQAVRTHIHMIG